MAISKSDYQAAIAANRFGIGARPGDLASIKSDPQGWLLSQLRRRSPKSVPDSDNVLDSSKKNLTGFFQNRGVRSAMRSGDSAKVDADIKKSGNLVQSVLAYSKPIYLAEVKARTQSALGSEAPLLERLVWFWSNHFTVSADKPAVTPIAGAFEREAIRPHILGRFEDMLRAVTQHPAMILYLDNQASFGPNSRVGRRTGRGINENLAREILELHTLGVTGGYGQGDVKAFAAALTGWTVNNGNRKKSGVGEFWYADFVHEPGTKRVMGKTYSQNGQSQAIAILKDLARHPSTATHIATKLARHFIADNPPEAAVRALAKTFQDTNGDLRAVAKTLVSLDEAWASNQRKVKTPQDYVVSGLRALGVPSVEAGPIVGSLDSLGQRPFFAPSPAGWPDSAEHWTGPDSVYKRIEWAMAVGERTGPYVEAPALIAAMALGPNASDNLITHMTRAESPAQAVTLMLTSPEFQRR